MNKRSYPAYSMGVRSKPTVISVIPGPGAYEPIIIQKSPSHKIGRSLRKIGINMQSPGPGAYNFNSVPSSPKVFLTGKPHQNPTPNIPGPGAYNPNFNSVIKKMPKYTICHQNLRNQMPDGPGPAQYNVNFNSTAKSNGKAVFGSASRLSKKMLAQNTPGPGSYEYQKSKLYSNNQKYGIIGKDSRNTKQKFYVPGPGEYNIKTNIEQAIEKKKGFHMGYKSRCNTESPSPGPAAYHQNTQTIAKNTPSYSIERANRKNQSNHNPGPGFYDLARTTLSRIGYSIGNDKREKMKTQIVPGPGEYNIPSYISNLPAFQRSKSVIFKKQNSLQK